MENRISRLPAMVCIIAIAWIFPVMPCVPGFAGQTGCICCIGCIGCIGAGLIGGMAVPQFVHRSLRPVFCERHVGQVTYLVAMFKWEVFQCCGWAFRPKRDIKTRAFC